MRKIFIFLLCILVLGSYAQKDAESKTPKDPKAKAILEQFKK